jgi:WhiB family redox-sensing transcriptional regulator
MSAQHLHLAHLLDELAVAEPWRDDALCAQVDPDLWFPEKGGSTGQAKQLCQVCPVIDDCLSYALTQSSSDDWGVWGGTTEHERRQLRQEGAA